MNLEPKITSFYFARENKSVVISVSQPVFSTGYISTIPHDRESVKIDCISPWAK
jgi:hypothetical protein